MEYSVDAYLDGLGWDGEKDRFGRDYNRVMQDLSQYGADVADRDYNRWLLDFASEYRAATAPPEAPSRLGMAPDGGQFYGDSGNMSDQPWFNDYTEQRDQVYNNPSWTPEDPFAGSEPVGTPGNMDWDWGRWGTQTDTGGFGQGYPDYDTTARYSPGQDAAWGSSEFPGNNRDFYQNQFANLLRQGQNFDMRQRQAANQRINAQQNPLPVPDLDWSWTTLPQNAVSTTDTPVAGVADGYAAPVANYNPGAAGGYNTSAVPGLIFDATVGTWVPTGAGRGGSNTTTAQQN